MRFRQVHALQSPSWAIFRLFPRRLSAGCEAPPECRTHSPRVVRGASRYESIRFLTLRGMHLVQRALSRADRQVPQLLALSPIMGFENSAGLRPLTASYLTSNRRRHYGDSPNRSRPISIGPSSVPLSEPAPSVSASCLVSSPAQSWKVERMPWTVAGVSAARHQLGLAVLRRSQGSRHRAWQAHELLSPAERIARLSGGLTPQQRQIVAEEIERMLAERLESKEPRTSMKRRRRSHKTRNRQRLATHTRRLRRQQRAPPSMMGGETAGPQGARGVGRWRTLRYLRAGRAGRYADTRT
jgi:hypothetical protein